MVLAVVFAVFTFAFIYFVDSYLTSTGKSVSQLAPWVNTVFGICVIGVQINAWLAFFNLIPWGNFDGYKVFQWNKKVWIIVFIGSIALFVLTLFCVIYSGKFFL